MCTMTCFSSVGELGCMSDIFSMVLIKQLKGAQRCVYVIHHLGESDLMKLGGPWFYLLQDDYTVYTPKDRQGN